MNSGSEGCLFFSRRLVGSDTFYIVICFPATFEITSLYPIQSYKGLSLAGHENGLGALVERSDDLWHFAPSIHVDIDLGHH